MVDTMIQVDESDPVGELQPSFPYRDVQIQRGVDMKELYDLQSEIGRGKFGTVYRCREKKTGLELAAKFVGTPRKEDRRSVEREVDIMRALQHPRLIQLYDAFDNCKVMCVVLELIEGGELFERVIDDDFLLTEKSCTVFMRQICEGIEFIHSQNILHLDMKPENILCLTKSGNRIKIIDFGLARKFDPHKKLQVLFGTPEFVAPEVVNFEQIGFATDMWSVGVICYVLLSGLSPFMGGTDIETMANVTIAKYDFDDQVFNEISEEAKDFIRKLLLKDRDLRLTASQCLSHSWLRRKPRPTEELDVSKDNLRFFVERWSEHPNSPYLFDISSHIISPCLLAELDPVPSHLSMRGNSPSPCGSLSSTSPDSVVDQPLLGKSPEDSSTFFQYTFEPSPPQFIPSRKYHLERLQTFERRASDSSCILRNNNDTAGRVNLADEIRKLSDKLFQMASLHVPTTDLTSNNYNIGLSPSPGFLSPSSAAYQTLIGPPTTAAIHNNLPTLSRGASNHWEDSSTGLKRTKFRVSNLNRDVPIGLPSSASNMLRFSSTCSSRTSSDNLTTSSTCSTTPSSPEPDPGADRTKDLLLHLLNKWDDKQANCNTQQTANQSCRKASISLEWSEQESLGQRTMNSLATYFQSSRTTNVDKTRSVVPP